MMSATEVEVEKGQCPVQHSKPQTVSTSSSVKEKKDTEEGMEIDIEDEIAISSESEELEEEESKEGVMDDEDIHSLLEVGIKKSGDGPRTYTKVVMKHFNEIDLHVLPEDWVMISHHSGIPVFLDRKRRVISVSRPYYLGNSSVRRHSIPLSAIPCLNYRRSLLKEGKPLNHDVGVITDDIRDAHNLTDESVVQRSDSITDSQRIPKLPSKPSEEDTSTTAPTPVPVPAPAPTQTPEQAPVPSEAPPVVGEDVEEGEILSENDEGQEKSKGTSRKRPNASAKEEGGEAGGGEGERSAPPRSSDPPSEGPNAKKVREEPEPAAGEETKTPGVESTVISVQEKEKELLLDPLAVREYCKRLFEFEEEHKVRFKTIKNKFRFLRTIKKMTREKPMTMMPKKANLIHYKVPLPADAPPNAKPREFVTNPAGKSFICILHEYCQMAVRRPPSYRFVEMENSTTPYAVTVLINGAVYAKGFGDSKKRAKLNAAKATLEMLIPGFAKIVTQMEEQAAEAPGGGTPGAVAGSSGAATAAKAAGLVSGPSKSVGAGRGWKTCSSHDLELFDSIAITDRRLQELSMRMALPGPHAILIEYLRRQCISEQSIVMDMTPKTNQRSQFTMSVKGEEVTVSCRSKREGRHLAAQALLQRFHPHITTWSGILKLYGPGSKPDRKVDQEVITELQSREKGSVKSSLIDLLRSQMKALAEEWEENGETSKGKFYIPPSQLPFIDFHPDSQNESQIE